MSEWDSDKAGEEDSSADLWNSGRLKKPKIDPAADTEEWLGTATPEDVERSSQKLDDVYADRTDSKPTPSEIIITHVEAPKNDQDLIKLILIGIGLLVVSSFVQVFRAENLRPPPKPQVSSSPRTSTSDDVPEDTVKMPPPDLAIRSETRPREPIPVERRPSEPAVLPKIQSISADGGRSSPVIVQVIIRNDSNSRSKPGTLQVTIGPRGQEPVSLEGEIASLSAGRKVEIKIETPFQVTTPLNDARGGFRAKDGLDIVYDAKVIEK
jgi:hypothetical protein